MFDEEIIREKVAQLGARQPWNHNIALPYGIETKPGEQVSAGKNLIKWQRIEPLLETIGVAGKRVLDVGCNEGFFSLRLAEMDATVGGIDIDESRIEKAEFVRQVLRADNVSFAVLDIYSQVFADTPRYDLCVCLGFLHRVPEPFTVLSRLSDRSDLILLEWKPLKHGPHDEPFAYYTPGGYAKDDPYGTQFWLLSFASVEAMLGRLGFDRFHRVDDPRSRRGILVAGRVANPIFDLPDVVRHRGRLPTLLSHTKRYIKTVGKIMSGRING